MSSLRSFRFVRYQSKDPTMFLKNSHFRLLFLFIRSSIYICTFCDLLENQKFVWNGGLGVGFLVVVEVDIGFNSHHGLTTYCFWMSFWMGASFSVCTWFLGLGGPKIPTQSEPGFRGNWSIRLIGPWWICWEFWFSLLSVQVYFYIPWISFKKKEWQFWFCAQENPPQPKIFGFWGQKTLDF